MSIKHSVKELFFISYLLFLIIPAIATLPLPYRPNSPTLLIAPQALLSNHVEDMIKEARYQANMLRDDAEREARSTAVVEVRQFGGADK